MDSEISQGVWQSGDGTKGVNGLVLMTTYACQLACPYCGVNICGRSMTPEVIRKSLALLYSTSAPQAQLRLFGGEPLARFDLVRLSFDQALRLEKKTGKKTQLSITTNGLLLEGERLDYLLKTNAHVLFSMDGGPATHARLRPPAKGNRAETYGQILKNLNNLKPAGLSYFVNMVVSPDNLDVFEKDFAALADAGARRIQVSYRLGIFWSREQTDAFLCAIGGIMQNPPPGIEIMNLYNNAEPAILAHELIADIDGKIYNDGGIFMEKFFPELRKAYLRGDVNRIRSIDDMYRDRAELLRIMMRTYPSGSPGRRLILNNLKTGMRVKAFIERMQNQKNSPRTTQK